jgi:ferric-dicitrate binding protein FerR (iron transport regulator)
MKDPRVPELHGSTVRMLLAATLLLAVRAASAQEVGTVAAADGTVQIGRNAAWIDAAPGAAVQEGDTLRTGRPGRLRVVFQDDSVLTLSDDSRVTVDEQVFDPNKGNARSLIGLLQGKVSALVSDYYHRSGSAYEVKTATAVAGVRGTEFTMSYDERDQVTEVIGLSGHVQVHSSIDPTGPGVLVTASETTTVAAGQLPTAPRRLEEHMFRQQMEGIEFIGAGAGQGMTLDHPLRSGASVLAPDSAPNVAAGAPTQREQRDVSSLVGKSPLVLQASKGQLGIVFGFTKN